RHPVADTEDLVEAMRDVEDGRAAVADLADQLEQVADLLIRQSGRRLVEDEQAVLLHAAVEGPGDRQHASLGGGELLRGCGAVDLEAEAFEPLLRGLALTTIGKPPRTKVPAAEGEVVDGVEVVDQPEVLMDEAQAGVPCCDR